MDVKCYLPDDLGERAKAADVNFSRLLRTAVIEDLHRRQQIEGGLEGAEVFEVDAYDAEGNSYIARFTGILLGHSGNGQVYLAAADDRRQSYDRLIVYQDPMSIRVYTLGDHYDEDIAEDVLATLDKASAIRVLHRVGITPVIDI